MDMTDCLKPLHNDNGVQFSLLSVQNILRSLRGLEPHCVRRVSRQNDENLSTAATVVSSSSSSPSRLFVDGGRAVYDSEAILNMLAWCDDADGFDEVPLSFPSSPSATVPRETFSRRTNDNAVSSDFKQFSFEHCKSVANSNLFQGASMQSDMSRPKSPAFYDKSQGIRCGVTSIIGNYEDAGLATCIASPSTDSLDHCTQSGAATHSFRPIANPLLSSFIVDEGLMDGSSAAQSKEIRNFQHIKDCLPSEQGENFSKRAVVEQLKIIPTYRSSTILGGDGIVPTVTARSDDGDYTGDSDIVDRNSSSPPHPSNQSRTSSLGLLSRSSSRRGSFAGADNSDTFSGSVQMLHDHPSYGLTAARVTDDSWKHPHSSATTLRSSYCGESTWKRNSGISEAAHLGNDRGRGRGYRPVPDQTAFDRHFVSTVCDDISSAPSAGQWASTPVKGYSLCPDTPVRTPTWRSASSACYPSSSRDALNALEASAALEISLTETKLFHTRSESPNHSEVRFYDDFEHEGFLGSGASADVYRVREKGTGRSHAIKKIKHQFRSEKDRSIMMGEVTTMRKVGIAPCDFVVKLVKAWQEDAYFFLQIDLAERGSIYDLIRDVARRGDIFSDSCLWHVMHDVSAGLAHIHTHGVIHLGE
jgi:Protein kinase domain